MHSNPIIRASLKCSNTFIYTSPPPTLHRKTLQIHTCWVISFKSLPILYPTRAKKLFNLWFIDQHLGIWNWEYRFILLRKPRSLSHNQATQICANCSWFLVVNEVVTRRKKEVITVKEEFITVNDQVTPDIGQYWRITSDLALITSQTANSSKESKI
jgi:hypothetical protein